MNLLLLALAIAAPVPKEAAKPPELTPGSYRILWNACPYSAGLSDTGQFAEIADGADRWWIGEWSWDPQTRTLSVADLLGDGEFFYRWKVVLDSQLKGRTDGGVSVSLKPSK